MTRDVDFEIDIFSGRPNPTVTVCGLAAERLTTMLRNSHVRLKAVPTDDALGFRGFIVRSEVGEDAGYRVLDGALVHGGTAFADTNRATETYILSLLPHDLKSLVQPFLREPPHR